jgi:methionyl aminopeptidase
MTVDTERDLEGLKKIGQIVGMTLQEMIKHVEPGITTKELDDIGAAFMEKHGARSAPIVMYQFPGATCISLNNEAAHGIPGDRKIQPGDLVNVDVSAELDGYYGDTGYTLIAPPVSDLKRKLAECAHKAMWNGIAEARAGRPLNAIGRAMENTAKGCGFTTIRTLPGHGIGHSLHEEPSVPGFFNPKLTQRLPRGLVITIEPFVTTGARNIVEAKDGWTLLTTDGSLSAQYEHTIVVTRGKPIILTQVDPQ